MELVTAIDSEKGDDLVVSFSLANPHDPLALECLILLRTPKYEGLWDESERGVTVSLERQESDEPEYLQEVTYLADVNQMIVRTNETRYELDLQQVPTKEIDAMARLLRTVNFDDRIHLAGL